MVGFALHNLVDYGWHVTATGLGFWVLAALAGAARDVEAPSVPEPSPPASGKKGRRAPPSEAPRGAVSWGALAVAVIAAGLPAWAAVNALRAEALARQGDPQGAAALDPLNEEYPKQLALLATEAAETGRTELVPRAFAEWRAVQRLRPTYPGVPYNLGLLYERLGHRQQALAEYRAAEQLAPTWTRALVAEARLLTAMGRAAEARRVYQRLDALSESPLFRYRAVVDDLDPSFAVAWVALGDAEPPDRARERHVRAATYLRTVLAANRRMEAVWRHSGEWERRHDAEFRALCEATARRHVAFADPGPRLRAALLLVDAGESDTAKELLLRPGDAFTGSVIDGWDLHVQALHLAAQGRAEAAQTLTRQAAATLTEALGDRAAVAGASRGAYGLSAAEVAELAAAAGVPGQAAPALSGK
jgi:tetratricopeptide (TPR) repeat protein